MYKALAYKELRETGWIAAIVFLAMMGVVLDQMGVELDLKHLIRSAREGRDPLEARPIPFIHSGLKEYLSLALLCGALVMGFQQTLGETYRRTWSFLLTRPLSRNAAIVTKLLVGSLLLLTATILPLMILAVWAATPGTHASPFDWRMTCEPVRICFAGTTVHLAAFLAGLRGARWYGSRLLPLFPAGASVLWVYEVGGWSGIGWTVIVCTYAIYFAAILLTARVRDYA